MVRPRRSRTGGFRALVSLLLLHQLAEISAEKSASDLTPEQMECILKKMDLAVDWRLEFEGKLAKQGRVIKPEDRITDPSTMRNKKMDPKYRDMEIEQMPFDLQSKYVSKKYNKTDSDMPKTGDYLKEREDNCSKATKPSSRCDKESKYRTADGSCNNFKHPERGSTKNCQLRLLPPQYVGSTGFRESAQGGPLPEPRDLSLNLCSHVDKPSKKLTQMFVFFGQLVMNDISFTPKSTTVDNQAIDCCPPKKKTHPQCKPIIIKEDDPFYSKHEITCLNYVRSLICPTCTLGARVPMVQVTSFIDCSFLYGNSEKEMDSLRKKEKGQMKIQNHKSGALLPRSNAKTDQCSFPRKKQYCFLGGDSRVNQHPILAALHTVFLREHNRVAKELHQLNPHWDDERLFQETRRIIGAEMQSIVYGQFLPIVLSSDVMKRYELVVGNTTAYREKEDPSMLVEFTTACARFGHSLINSQLTVGSEDSAKKLRDNFLEPFALYKGILGQLLRDASNFEAQELDQHMVPDVTNYLFRIRGDKTGFDLAAIDIQRGRDHGLPPYTAVVNHCSEGKLKIESFDDLSSKSIMKAEQAEALKKNYKDVKDIDLFVGILVETPYPKAIIGPTAACIVAKQFYRLKYGDRFYFEHDNVPNKFSKKQIEELRRATLSRIFCANTEADSMPGNPMLFHSSNNEGTVCDNDEGINLKYWKEKESEGDSPQEN